MLKMGGQWRHSGQAVHQMVGHHLSGVAHRRQVVNPRPLGNEIQVGQQRVNLSRRQGQTQTWQGLLHPLARR